MLWIAKPAARTLKCFAAFDGHCAAWNTWLGFPQTRVALTAMSCASPELLWLHQHHGACAGTLENELASVWPSRKVLSMTVSLHLCVLHCKTQAGLLLRKLRLVWLVHLCWPMPCCLCCFLSHPH